MKVFPRRTIISKKVEAKLLKILATDKEDLDVFSAFLQDAIIPLNGLDFCKDDQTFRIFANRYRWELSENKKEKFFHQKVNHQIT